MMIRAVSRQEFDRFDVARVRSGDVTRREVEWFVDETQRLLAVITQHGPDEALQWFITIFERGPGGRFRVCDLAAGLRDADAARELLFVSMQRRRMVTSHGACPPAA
jgi:hypothetical protein